MTLVRTHRDRIAYYHLETGAHFSEQRLAIPDPSQRDADAWRVFISDLKAPNGAQLPYVRAKNVSALLTNDGRMRFYSIGDASLAVFPIAGGGGAVEVCGRAVRAYVDPSSSFFLDGCSGCGTGSVRSVSKLALHPGSSAWARQLPNGMSLSFANAPITAIFFPDFGNGNSFFSFR